MVKVQEVQEEAAWAHSLEAESSMEAGGGVWKPQRQQEGEGIQVTLCGAESMGAISPGDRGPSQKLGLCFLSSTMR